MNLERAIFVFSSLEELLFLGVGLNMAYHLRNAQQCLERHLLTTSLVIEVS